MMINDVHRGIKKFKKRKRIGRGPGSGHGKTAGRGHKGQQSPRGLVAQAGISRWCHAVGATRSQTWI